MSTCVPSISCLCSCVSAASALVTQLLPRLSLGCLSGSVTQLPLFCVSAASAPVIQLPLPLTLTVLTPPHSRHPPSVTVLSPSHSAESIPLHSAASLPSHSACAPIVHLHLCTYRSCPSVRVPLPLLLSSSNLVEASVPVSVPHVLLSRNTEPHPIQCCASHSAAPHTVLPSFGAAPFTVLPSQCGPSHSAVHQTVFFAQCPHSAAP